VYVTHDQIEAMTLGDKVAVMKDGIIQQFGTPRQIYKRIQERELLAGKLPRQVLGKHAGSIPFRVFLRSSALLWNRVAQPEVKTKPRWKRGS
jgi:ABC-type multidrug transport system ATPase subunit